MLRAGLARTDLATAETQLTAAGFADVTEPGGAPGSRWTRNTGSLLAMVTLSGESVTAQIMGQGDRVETVAHFLLVRTGRKGERTPCLWPEAIATQDAHVAMTLDMVERHLATRRGRPKRRPAAAA